MFSTSTAILLAATLASTATAKPIAARFAEIDPSQPFALQYVERDPTATDPTQPFSGVSHESDTLYMFEPTEGIPLAKVRELQPTQGTGEVTPVTLLGGYLHVSADDVAIPGSTPGSFGNYGWNSNNTIGFADGGAGPLRFEAENFGADGDMHMKPGANSAIDLGGDYTKFWLCGKDNGGNGKYLAFGQDPASTAPCMPIFLYGVPVPCDE